MGEPQPVLHQVTGQCIVCEEKDKWLYKGTRYQCHLGTDGHRKQHNQMCHRCASGVDNLYCPIHLEPVFLDCSVYRIEPTLYGECEGECSVTMTSHRMDENYASASNIQSPSRNAGQEFTQLSTTRQDFPPLVNNLEFPPAYDELPPTNQSPELSSNKTGLPPTYQALSTSNKMELPPPSQSPTGVVHDQQMHPFSIAPPTYSQGVNSSTDQVASQNQPILPSAPTKTEPLHPGIIYSPNQQQIASHSEISGQQVNQPSSSNVPPLSYSQGIVDSPNQLGSGSYQQPQPSSANQLGSGSYQQPQPSSANQLGSGTYQQPQPSRASPVPLGPGVGGSSVQQLGHCGGFDQQMNPTDRNQTVPFSFNPSASSSPNQQVLHSAGLQQQQPVVQRQELPMASSDHLTSSEKSKKKKIKRIAKLMSKLSPKKLYFFRKT